MEIIRTFFLVPLMLVSSVYADSAEHRAFAYERKAAHEQRLPDATQGEIAHHIAEDIVARYRGRKPQPAPTQPAAHEGDGIWKSAKNFVTKLFNAAEDQTANKPKLQQPVLADEVLTQVREMSGTQTAATANKAQPVVEPVASLPASVYKAEQESKPAAVTVPVVPALVTIAAIPDVPVTTAFVPAHVSMPALEIVTDYIPDVNKQQHVEVDRPQVLPVAEQPAVNTPTLWVVDIPDAPITAELVPAQAIINDMPVATDYIPAAPEVPEDTRVYDKVQMHEIWGAHEVHGVNQEAMAATIAAERERIQKYVHQQLPNNEPTVEHNTDQHAAYADTQAVTLEQLPVTEQPSGLHYYWSMYTQAWQEQTGATAAKTALGVGLGALVIYATYKGGKWLYNKYMAPKITKKAGKHKKARKQIRKKLRLY